MTNINNLLPFQKRVLVKRIYRTTINKIEIPTNTIENENLILGEVISVSKESGEFFSIGNKIYFPRHSFNKIDSLENEEIGVISIDNIYLLLN